MITSLQYLPFRHAELSFRQEREKKPEVILSQTRGILCIKEGRPNSSYSQTPHDLMFFLSGDCSRQSWELRIRKYECQDVEQKGCSREKNIYEVELTGFSSQLNPNSPSSLLHLIFKWWPLAGMLALLGFLYHIANIYLGSWVSVIFKWFFDSLLFHPV